MKEHKGLKKVTFFADNTGMEIISDLLLIDYLISTKTVHEMYLYIKPYPIWVSDVLTIYSNLYLYFFKKKPIGYIKRYR